MENQNLATEIIHELKTQNKRWIIIALVELTIIIDLAVAFIWYANLLSDETDTQSEPNYIEQDDDLYTGNR